MDPLRAVYPRNNSGSIDLVADTLTCTSMICGSMTAASQTITTLSATNVITSAITSAGDMTIDAGTTNNILLNSISTGHTIIPYVDATGTLRLPDTTNSSQVILKGSSAWEHNYPGAGASNVFLGKASGNFTCSGTPNVGIGNQTLQALSSGSSNTAVGDFAGSAVSTGLQNTHIGASAGAGANQNRVIAIGCNATAGAAFSNLICLQTNALASGTAPASSNEIRLGFGDVASSTCFVDGIYNATSLGTSRIMSIKSDGRVSATTGTATLQGALSTTFGITAQSQNITCTTGNINLSSATSGYTINSQTVLRSPGNRNGFSGPLAGNVTLTGTDNQGSGYQSLKALTTGSNNSALGTNSLQNATEASFNVAVGNTAGNALTGAGATGTGNTYLGYGAGFSVTTGSYNTHIGYNTGGGNSGSDNSNIYIGAGQAGSAGESGVIRIGTGVGTPIAQCFIDGIRGVTTGSVTGVPVLIDTNGQLGTISSSIRFKENVLPLAPMLDRVCQLKPCDFNYISDAQKKRQPGLIAEEVASIFPDLVAYDRNGNVETVYYNLMFAMLIKCMQELNNKIGK